MIEFSELAHNKYLLARRVERLITSDLFERISKKFTDKDKEKIKKCINDLDIKKLKEIVGEHDAREIGDLNSREIRYIAKRLHIPNYCREPKWRLLQEIQKSISLNEALTGDTLDVMALLKDYDKCKI